MKLLTLSILATLVSCSYRSTVIPARTTLDPIPVTVEHKVGADTLATRQTNLNLKEVWENYPSSKRVKIAVLGSGVDYNHEDIRKNIYVNTKEFPEGTNRLDKAENAKDDDGNGYIDDIVGFDFVDNDGLPYEKMSEYGTAAAGVIGAVHDNSRGIKGINKKVNIIPVRYIDENGIGRVNHFYNALKYSLKAGADVIYVHMVNLDFSQRIDLAAQKSAFASILKEVSEKNVSIVLSAGSLNYNLDSSGGGLISMLAKSPNVIIVTSVNQNNELSVISNYGVEMVDMAASGDNIFSTAPRNKYKAFSGTHIAAAQVAGALAYAHSLYYGELSVEKLHAALFEEGATDILNKLKFLVNGSNKLNIKKYLDFLSLAR